MEIKTFLYLLRVLIQDLLLLLSDNLETSYTLFLLSTLFE